MEKGASLNHCNNHPTLASLREGGCRVWAATSLMHESCFSFSHRLLPIFAPTRWGQSLNKLFLLCSASAGGIEWKHVSEIYVKHRPTEDASSRRAQPHKSFFPSQTSSGPVLIRAVTLWLTSQLPLLGHHRHQLCHSSVRIFRPAAFSRCCFEALEKTTIDVTGTVVYNEAANCEWKHPPFTFSCSRLTIGNTLDNKLTNLSLFTLSLLAAAPQPHAPLCTLIPLRRDSRSTGN